MFSKANIDGVQNTFLRNILSLPRGTPASGLRPELDSPMSTYWKAKERALNFWAKTVWLHDDRLVKQALLRQKELAEMGIDCWGKRIKSMLSTIGVEEFVGATSYTKANEGQIQRGAGQTSPW